MLQRIRVAALAIVLGAGVVTLAPSAATAAPAPVVGRVAISPSPPIDVTAGAVTATFSFLTQNTDKAEFQLKPPGISVGTPIALTSSKAGDWTRWTGTKAFDSKVAGTWSWLAIAGSASRGDTFDVVVKKPLETKFADFDASPDRVAKGSPIRVTGRLLADGNSYVGQSVTISFRARGADAFREVTKVTTGRAGWFGTTVRADATGWWRAEFVATSAAKGSISDADRVDVRRGRLGSRIAGFDARPEPVDKGDKLSFTGALQVERRGGVAGERVSIFFKANGSHKWQYVTSDVTGRQGRFWASATAETSGWWRAEYAGNRRVNGSVSDEDWVRVDQPAPPPTAKADTRLIRFNAYPEPIKRGKYLKFGGKLQVDDEGSWEGYSGKVALYFLPVGARKWQYVKTTGSGDSGRLYTKVKAWNSGYWKFVFGGDEDTYGSDSRRDYVRVKR
ncbi:hypothetical protein SAMN05444920_102417 [Nonomuraea solani]|uniref:Uncharacterized protein n=1 Tax=Nonomuraea solani TaxID=1144553 RepID=A0A1H5YVM7_9ACTN|nr:hypothetical protein [Nonomuraea solani]SEG27527.1 hypothetical protein SAMN05444920_102417 [Nonomuraea solani]